MQCSEIAVCAEIQTEHKMRRVAIILMLNPMV